MENSAWSSFFFIDWSHFCELPFKGDMDFGNADIVPVFGWFISFSISSLRSAHTYRSNGFRLCQDYLVGDCFDQNSETWCLNRVSKFCEMGTPQNPPLAHNLLRKSQYWKTILRNKKIKKFGWQVDVWSAKFALPAHFPLRESHWAVFPLNRRTAQPGTMGLVLALFRSEGLRLYFGISINLKQRKRKPFSWW